MTDRSQLQLAHAPKSPAEQRDPQKPGGGRDGGASAFAEFAARVYQDPRADAQSRQLLLAMAYVLTSSTAPTKGKAFWTAVHAAVCGPSPRVPLKELIRQDVPRYEPFGHYWGEDPLDGLCVGPRQRPHPRADDIRNRMNICGARAQDMVVELLPGTGWHKRHWFCTRHHAHLARVREQLREQNARAPEPVPNKGGLLPSYFDSDWLTIYRRATAAPAWEPPVYGMRADDWPVPGQEPVPQRARLRLIAAPATEPA